MPEAKDVIFLGLVFRGLGVEAVGFGDCLLRLWEDVGICCQGRLETVLSALFSLIFLYPTLGIILIVSWCETCDFSKIPSCIAFCSAL